MTLSSNSKFAYTDENEPRLGYLDTGPSSETAIVLLHSLGADHRMWRNQVDALSTQYRVIAPDTRGHGSSTGRGSTTVANWVADLDRVLDVAEVGHAVLVGVSMGGIQAVAYAADKPARVQALVVADSFVALPAEIAETKIAGLVGQARDEGMSALAERYLDDTFTRTPLPDVAGDIREAIAGMRPQDYINAVHTCFGAQITDKLSRLRVPTLVLWGQLDSKTPKWLSEHITTGVAGAELKEIPNAGHLSNVENSAKFTELLTNFLAQHAPQPAGAEPERIGRQRDG